MESSSKLKVVQHRDRKEYDDVAYCGLHDQNKIQKQNLCSVSF